MRYKLLEMVLVVNYQSQEVLVKQNLSLTDNWQLKTENY